MNRSQFDDVMAHVHKRFPQFRAFSKDPENVEYVWSLLGGHDQSFVMSAVDRVWLDDPETFNTQIIPAINKAMGTLLNTGTTYGGDSEPDPVDLSGLTCKLCDQNGLVAIVVQPDQYLETAGGKQLPAGAITCVACRCRRGTEKQNMREAARRENPHPRWKGKSEGEPPLADFNTSMTVWRGSFGQILQAEGNVVDGTSTDEVLGYLAERRAER